MKRSRGETDEDDENSSLSQRTRQVRNLDDNYQPLQESSAPPSAPPPAYSSDQLYANNQQYDPFNQDIEPIRYFPPTGSVLNSTQRETMDHQISQHMVDPGMPPGYAILPPTSHAQMPNVNDRQQHHHLQQQDFIPIQNLLTEHHSPQQQQQQQQQQYQQCQQHQQHQQHQQQQQQSLPGILNLDESTACYPSAMFHLSSHNIPAIQLQATRDTGESVLLNQGPEHTGLPVPAQSQRQDQSLGAGLNPQIFLPIAAAIPHPRPAKSGISLSLAWDSEHLSEYQVQVRRQLEVFVADQGDTESNTQGRKKRVVLGQVGIRCRHCWRLPIRSRGRGSVYYPTKLDGIYQAAQNMSSTHLCESCKSIPPELKQQIQELRGRRDTASGGKQYWADGARRIGLYETPEGLMMRDDVSQATNP